MKNLMGLELKRGSLKAYKEFLNKKYGFTDKFGTRGSKGTVWYGAKVRLYGDYLYNQDKQMFLNDLALDLGLHGTSPLNPEFKAIYDSLK